MQIWEVREYILDYGFDEDGYRVGDLYFTREAAVEAAKEHLNSNREDVDVLTLLFSGDTREVWANLDEEDVQKVDMSADEMPDWLYSFVAVEPVEVR